MKRVAIIFGTRPEAIKLLPVFISASRHDKIHPLLISTGQHREIVHDVLELFHCRPDHDLAVMEQSQSLAGVTSKILHGLDPLLDESIDLIMVQGDTTTALVGSMLAFFKGIPCAHVEAGLRSGNLQSPFPEEYNRKVISMTAKWHFAPTEGAAENLRREGVVDGIHVVGNTSIDAALMIGGSRSGPSSTLRKMLHRLDDTNRPYVLVTAHRRENFGAPLEQIIGAVASIATDNPDLDIVWPVHPNPNVRECVHRLLPKLPNVFLIEPVRYDDLIQLIKRALVILTDSGGIQEEAPAFSKPVIVLRDTTERPEGLSAGCSVLAGVEKARILELFYQITGDRDVYKRMCDARNPYGDGTASRQIIEVIGRPG